MPNFVLKFPKTERIRTFAKIEELLREMNLNFATVHLKTSDSKALINFATHDDLMSAHESLKQLYPEVSIYDPERKPAPDVVSERTDADKKLDSRIRAAGKGLLKEDKVDNGLGDLLKVKPNVVLQGPPGTGKTRLAKLFCARLFFLEAKPTANEDALLKELEMDAAVARKYFYDGTATTESGEAFKEGAWTLIQFHQSLNYEDFVRGIRMETSGGTVVPTVVYKTENKILGQMCDLAARHPNAPFVLVLDEINRANLSAVFGECIYALEYRDTAVMTPYAVGLALSPQKGLAEAATATTAADALTDEAASPSPENEGQTPQLSGALVIPSNLFVIGTMNTADRSVGHIDYAIRRRFAFVSVLPDENVLGKAGDKNFDAFKVISELFKSSDPKVGKTDNKTYALSENYKAEDVQIGHSYFLGSKLELRIKYEVAPILREYMRDGIFKHGTDIEKIITSAIEKAKSGP